jgi:hypothetical protein
MSDGEKKIVQFPTEISPEERARRLGVEVERLAKLPPFEWLMYLPDVATKYGLEPDQLKEIIKATIRENDKRVREAKADDRREKQRVERKQEREDKLARQEKERARKEAERIEREQEARQKKARSGAC